MSRADCTYPHIRYIKVIKNLRVSYLLAAEVQSFNLTLGVKTT
jgi:hypothetical protein